MEAQAPVAVDSGDGGADPALTKYTDTSAELIRVRERASEALEQTLPDEIKKVVASDEPIKPWVNPDVPYRPSEAGADTAVRDKKIQFDTQGFIVERGFCSKEECLKMIARMTQVVDDKWNPGEEKVEVFRTDDKQEEAQGSSDYFLDS